MKASADSLACLGPLFRRCMPQGERTAAEKISFMWMLRNVNLLYLGTQVLVLLDLSYQSRFWTQFEAWLSMQDCKESGLQPSIRLYENIAIVLHKKFHCSNYGVSNFLCKPH